MSMYGRPPSSSAANRPTSRIGPSWGRGIAATHLGNKNGNGLMQPPKTSQMGGMMPPPSRMTRPSSSLRGPTSMGDRPVTKQGIGDIPKTGYQGSGRTVQDRSYWIGEMRQRLTHLNEEINKIQSDITALEREQVGVITLEKRALNLSDELRDLQGQLGDYNMLLDKLHSDTGLDEVRQTTSSVTFNNDKLQLTVDTMFMERQEKERKIKEFEEELKTTKERASDLITNLDPTSRLQWAELEAENAQLHAELALHQTKLTQLVAKRNQFEETISQDASKHHVWTLQNQKINLRAKLREMQSIGTENSLLDTKEAILDEIKRTNGDIAHMEKQLAETEREQAQLISDVNAMETSIMGDKAAKYDELVKKDQEMQAFLDTFPNQYQSAKDQLTELQNQHRSLLAEIQSLTVAPMVTPAEFKKMTGDLEAKNKELTTAETTMTHVADERERLIADLAQIDSLDGKIATQLVTATTRMQQLRMDLEKFACVDETKEKLNQMRDQLTEQVKQIQHRQQWMHKILRTHTASLHVKRDQLAENEAAKTLAQLQGKWRQIEMGNSGLRAQISDKVSSADYRPVRDQVLKLTDQCLMQNAKMVNMAL